MVAKLDNEIKMENSQVASYLWKGGSSGFTSCILFVHGMALIDS
jgi:hypothetical protein